MKKFLSYLMYVCLTMAALSFTSCQEEFEELPQSNNQETIDASSSTAKLIERTSSNDGSFDNIVDGASCFAVNFPYHVNVNGLDLTIDSKEDLKLIKNIFDEVDGDSDILEIIFPITVTLSDYTEITINNKEELREIAKECIEGGNDDDIECIDFVYPITLYSFNVNLEQTGKVTVENDRQLRRFFAGLGEHDLVSFDFPISLELYDGTKVSVNSNAELANAIETAKNACDEDDDNDPHDNDFTKERLDQYLTKCPWLINEINREGVNQTDQYFDYLMNFTEDGKVVVKDRAGNVLNGTWNTRVTDNGALLKLSFDVLVDFNLEWYVYDIGEGKIKLYAGEGNRIIMHSVCDIFNNTPDTLREILKECSWVIKKVQNQGAEIDRLLGYKFTFEAGGVITLSNGTNTSTGTWAVTANAQGRLVMAITMGDEPGVSFEWPLSELKDNRLKFEVDGTDYELILIRVCDDNNDDGDVKEIRNIMMGGDWVVAQYKDNGEDKTSDYASYTFAFKGENAVHVTTGETGPTYPGLWRIIRDSENKLKVYLNFGENTPLDSLTDDWTFVSITESRIELKDMSGGANATDNLVFEKK